MTAVTIIGVPSDLGANMRGANIGPSAIRIAGLHEKLKMLGCVVEERGDIAVPLREMLSGQDISSKHRTAILHICEKLAEEVYKSLKKGHKPIVLGGDHSIGMGTVAGVSQFAREQNGLMGMIWIDAHADMNTPSSTHTGNIHGMPLSVALGLGYPDLVNLCGFSPKVIPQNVALIGIRTLDSEEKEICRKAAFVISPFARISPLSSLTAIAPKYFMGAMPTGMPNSRIVFKAFNFGLVADSPAK